MASEKLVGEELGQYIVLQEIAFGGFSGVYKAYHGGLERFSAIKVLSSEFSTNTNFHAMFRREAINLASLNHPNIVNVYDCGVKGDIPYIIMEYISGVTLASKISDFKKKKEYLPLNESVNIVSKLAEALSYAHKRDMVHGDVKPDNVLIENTNRIVLIDFGLSKLVTGHTEITGVVNGTPAYMAPEQAMGMPRRDYSDIYSLGVIFYQLVTGQLPFSSKNPLGLLKLHIEEPVIPPRSIRKEVPKRIEKIILKALEKKPENRYQSLDEMLADIKNLKEFKKDKLPTATLTLPSLPSEYTDQNIKLILHIIDTGQILELPEDNEFILGRKPAGSQSTKIGRAHV